MLSQFKSAMSVVKTTQAKTQLGELHAPSLCHGGGVSVSRTQEKGDISDRARFSVGGSSSEGRNHSAVAWAR